MRSKKNDDGFVPGMLTNITDVKIIICYLLKTVGEPMDKEKIIEMIFANDIAGYFDVRDAVLNLVESGNITEDADGNVSVTESGIAVAEELESALPLTTRSKIIREGIKINNLAKRAKGNKANVEVTPAGIFVKCDLLDGENEVMTFKMLVADELQAQTVKEQFLENPAGVYQKFISALLNNEE